MNDKVMPIYEIFNFIMTRETQYDHDGVKIAFRVDLNGKDAKKLTEQQTKDERNALIELLFNMIDYLVRRGGVGHGNPYNPPSQIPGYPNWQPAPNYTWQQMAGQQNMYQQFLEALGKGLGLPN